ncbi:MAG: hypothetical protein ACFE9D_07420 [Promethearchaeota archaeon]
MVLSASHKLVWSRFIGPVYTPDILFYPSYKQFELRVFFSIVGSITTVIRALTGR